MKISLDWVSDFVTLPARLSAAQIATELTLKTVEVEAVTEIDGDAILEVDNKSLTNRPDLWGHYGIARELAAIFDTPLQPLPMAELPVAVSGLIGQLDPQLCARFTAVRFDLPAGRPTVDLVRERLARIGESSLGFCVDLGNYVMFTVGQPVHVYDAAKLSGPLSVRESGAVGVLDLLTGMRVSLTPDLPVVADGTVPVALAGVMGAANTAVDPDSASFLLEAASFSAVRVRRSSQQTGLRTEASARYEKGLDTQRVDAAVGYFLHLLQQAAPDAAILGAQQLIGEQTQPVTVSVTRRFLDTRIGAVLPTEEIVRTLVALGFGVVELADGFEAAAPTWRSTGDISLPHDILEELARVHGYDDLAAADITTTLTDVRSLNRKPLARSLREQLGTRGQLREVITYPWVSDQLLASIGMTKADTVRFDQAPAPNLDSLRPSLIPNLLAAVAKNMNYFAQVRIFEVGAVFHPEVAVPPHPEFEPLPTQKTSVAIALTGDDGPQLFREARGLVEMLERACFLTNLEVGGSTAVGWADASARTAVTAGGTGIGAIGLLRPQVLRATGIDAPYVACVELELDTLTVASSRDNSFTPLPQWPEATFDLSVVVDDMVSWAEVAAVAGLEPGISGAVDHRLRFVDEYRGPSIPAGSHSVTFSVTLRPKTATLSAAEIAEARLAILSVLTERLGAVER